MPEDRNLWGRSEAVLLFGNGLSIGFDPAFHSRTLSERVRARLGAAHTAVLEDLARTLPAEVQDDPIGINRGEFERLAGPLDRLSGALRISEALPAPPPGWLATLQAASLEFRRNYIRIVGTVLSEVDVLCHPPAPLDGTRREQWRSLNAFADALITLDNGRRRLAVFTVNYDSLLHSALLQKSPFVYDGFRGGRLNVPLDRWSEPTLYHLHGSTSWISQPGGIVESRRLAVLRRADIFTEWAAGRITAGIPTVLLTDLKNLLATRYPFVVFYEELRRQLQSARIAVAGGYSFGDRPLNQAFAEFLSRSRTNRLEVWGPDPDGPRILDRLQRYLPHRSRFVNDQVVTVPVTLPSADVIREFGTRI
jgi:hypothetical protein